MTWRRKSSPASPSPRVIDLTFDGAAKNIVRFGGDDGGGDCCRVYLQRHRELGGDIVTNNTWLFVPVPEALIRYLRTNMASTANVAGKRLIGICCPARVSDRVTIW